MKPLRWCNGSSSHWMWIRPASWSSTDRRGPDAGSDVGEEHRVEYVDQSGKTFFLIFYFFYHTPIDQCEHMHARTHMYKLICKCCKFEAISHT